MKGILLVLVGIFGLYAAWKIISLTRKGAPKEIKSLPDVDTSHRNQKDWSTGIVMKSDCSSDEAVCAIPVANAASSDGDRSSAIPSMGSIFSVAGK